MKENVFSFILAQHKSRKIWGIYEECRTLSRRPHDRRTHDRRQKTAVFLIAGHFAKYALLDKSPQIDYSDSHIDLIFIHSTDVVHISEDVIVIMNFCLWICFKNFLLSLPWRFYDGVLLNEGAQANSSDVISLMNFHIYLASCAQLAVEICCWNQQLYYF